jgi:hypothetical protein
MVELDFNFILEFGKRINKLDDIEINSLIHLPYKFIKKDLPLLFQNNEFQIIAEKIIGKPIVKDNDKIINFALWVSDELKKINENEKVLSSDPEPEMIAAGINKLDVFDIYGVARSLTNDVLKVNEILELPYSDVFMALYYNKTTNDIQKAYQEIIRKKK